MTARSKFLIGGIIIVATLAWLGWVGAAESKTYYHTIAELTALKGSALRQRMRVSGWIEKGSIHRLTGRVDFVLQEDGRTLPVSYVGSDPLPDTFTGGAQALAQGRLMPDGRFVAEQVQAKCASKYVAAPNQSGSAGASPPQRSASGPMD